MTSGKVNIKINDKTGAYFSTNRGVRQGILCLLFCLNAVVDSLSVMIKNAQQEKLIVGMTPHLQENGVAILQYADDTIFLLDEGFEYARNLKNSFCVCLNKCWV
jgi:hypothetical protein